MTYAKADNPSQILLGSDKTNEAPWIIDPPTGWPAPFDLIQGLFESAWSGIIESIDFLWANIVKAVDNLWTSIVDAFWNQWLGIVHAVNSLWQSIIWGFDNLWAILWIHGLPTWENIRRGLGDIWKGFVDTLDYLWKSFDKAFNDLYSAMVDVSSKVTAWLWRQTITAIGEWDPDARRFRGGFLGWLWDAVAGLFYTVGQYFWGFGAWLTDVFQWMHTEISDCLVWIVKDLPLTLITAFKDFYNIIVGDAPATMVTALTNLRAASAFLHLASPQIPTPISPDEAKTFLEAFADRGFYNFLQAEVLAIILEAASFGQLDITISELFRNPMITAYHSIVETIAKTEHEAGLIPAYKNWMLKRYRPMIPGISEAQEMLWRDKLNMNQFRDVVAMYGFRDIYEEGYVELTQSIPPAPDIITMVVREAFVPEMVIQAPEEFAYWMTKRGFAKEWADRYWTAHFVPIALTQAYENLWRGYWTKEDFMRALHIADIHPMWREDIYQVAFRPPGVRELGYGYDTGLYSIEDIIRYRRWGGLAPEDAEKAGTAMVAYRTEAERETLRREALADYVVGLDTEEELRGKLGAIGGRPEIIDLWVARAKYREARDLKLDIIKVAKDQFVKGYIKEDELRQSLIDLGVKGERLEVNVLEAQTRRARYKAEETFEKKRKLSEAKIAKAWELGLIGDEQYTSALIERDYTEEDAKLLLEIERTPKPITPEELERRRRAITVRINRIQRRYEMMLARVDRQTALISGEIESLELEMKEVLDVIDTEISSIEEELAAITPEVLRRPILAAMERVKRRYERMLARLDMQTRATEEEITSTEMVFKETLDVIDVQIMYVEEELTALGVVP